MKKVQLIYASVMLISLLSCSSSRQHSSDKESPTPPPEEEVTYAVDFVTEGKLMPLLDQARKENKPVFIDIYTSWCLPCKLMDQDVFMDSRIGDYMNANFINFKVNAEQGHGVNLAAIFEVKAYPTLLFVSPEGRVLVRKEGAAYQSELRRLGDEAISRMRQEN